MIKRATCILLLATLLSCTKTTQEPSYGFAEAEPVRQLSDYWRSNYEVLDPDVDPRARRAHQIFDRVHNAAGSRPGVITELIVIGQDPFGTPRAEALPDGGIVVTKGVLDICYKDERYGDDRLAFVLAHEIAHQLKGDFWHYQFFGALDAEESKSSSNKAAVKQAREIAKQTDVVQAKELEADVEAIGYAAMAGFDPHAVVSDKEQTNFFAFWADALDPAKLVKITGDHPTPKVRATGVIAKLNEIAANTDYFRLGVLFYQAGKYCEAADAFRAFLAIFPSREVYHNLAACHHQLGLREDQNRLPFKLSFPIDTQTLASDALRGSGSRHMETAIAMYAMAIDLDPAYSLPYIGLGCAYLEVDEVYKGIATLQDAGRKSPVLVDAINNLAVGLYLNGKTEESKQLLSEVRRANPTYDAPVFNLAVIASDEADEEHARAYFTSYLELDSSSGWAKVLRRDVGMTDSPPPVISDRDVESANLGGATPGMAISEIPAEWGAPVYQRVLELEGTECKKLKRKFHVQVFDRGILVVAGEDGFDDPSIDILVALPYCLAASGSGVRVGSSITELRTAYGAPLRTFRTAEGDCWVYDDGKRDATFVVVDGIVRSWLLF